MQELRSITFNTLLEKGTGVNLAKLLEETEDGDQSQFMEAIRQQFLSEMNEFINSIGTKLMEEANNQSMLPAGQIEAILKEIDPNKPKDEVRIYMQRGLGQNTYSVDMKVNVQDFFKKLRLSGLVNKTGHYVSDAQPAPSVTFAFVQAIESPITQVQ